MPAFARLSARFWARLLAAGIGFWVLAILFGILRDTCDFYGGRFCDETGRYGAVTLKAVEPLPNAVTLVAIKADARLADMVLVKNSRLSVQPVSDAEWALIRSLGGL